MENEIELEFYIFQIAIMKLIPNMEKHVQVNG